METIIISLFIGACIFSAAFRKNVSDALNTTNEAFTTLNDVASVSLKEIKQSLPKREDTNNVNIELDEKSKKLKEKSKE